MFDEVAARYDLTNDVLSLGQDRRWRRAVVTGRRPAPGGAGARPRRRHRHVQLSRSPRRGARRRAVRLLARHAARSASGAARTCRSSPATRTRLPFADASFDAVTISFGLRNVARPRRRAAEMLRVTRPGGRLVVCEFSHPTWAPFRTVYVEYLMRALPAVARRLSSSPDAYVYLAESIRAWPDQRGAGGPASQRPAGREVGWRNLTGGIVALHRAVRPERDPKSATGSSSKSAGQGMILTGREGAAHPARSSRQSAS